MVVPQVELHCWHQMPFLTTPVYAIFFWKVLLEEEGHIYMEDLKHLGPHS